LRIKVRNLAKQSCFSASAGHVSCFTVSAPFRRSAVRDFGKTGAKRSTNGLSTAVPTGADRVVLLLPASKIKERPLRSEVYIDVNPGCGWNSNFDETLTADTLAPMSGHAIGLAARAAHIVNPPVLLRLKQDEMAVVSQHSRLRLVSPIGDYTQEC